MKIKKAHMILANAYADYGVDGKFNFNNAYDDIHQAMGIILDYTEETTEMLENSVAILDVGLPYKGDLQPAKDLIEKWRCNE